MSSNPPNPDHFSEETQAHPIRTTEERLTSGEVVNDRYLVVTHLGQGGMGDVYRADDLELGQPVALKFLRSGLANDPDYLSRFRQEVVIARQVTNPHCCRVHDIGEHQGKTFLTMEYIDGEDLASLLKRQGRLELEQAGRASAVHPQ